MNPLYFWFKLILIMIGWDKKTARQILVTASTIDTYTMCEALRRAITVILGYQYWWVSSTTIIWVFKGYGYTRTKYHDFVREHYPELEQYMEPSKDVAYWTDSIKAKEDGEIDAIKKSKREFLICLANKLTKTTDFAVKIELKV